jgi:hypothetical protein
MIRRFGALAIMLVLVVLSPACVSVVPTPYVSNPYEAALPPPNYDPQLPQCIVLDVELDATAPDQVRYALRNTCDSEVALCTWPGIFCARTRIDPVHGPELVTPPYPVSNEKACPIENILFLAPSKSVTGQYSLAAPTAPADESRVQCVFACSGSGFAWRVVLHWGLVWSHWLMPEKGTT